MKNIVRLVASFASILLAGATPAFAERDLETGTFLSRDPAGFVDGPNLYAYVQQNPWTKFDPTGLYSEIAKNGNDVDIKLRMVVRQKNLPPGGKGPVTYSPASAATEKRVKDAMESHWSGNQSGYNVTMTADIVTRASFPDPTGTDKYLTDEQHAQRYQYNLVTFEPNLAKETGNNGQTKGAFLHNITELDSGTASDRTIAHEGGRMMDVPDGGGSDRLMYPNSNPKATKITKADIDAAVLKRFSNDPSQPIGPSQPNIAPTKQSIIDSAKTHWNPNVPGSPMHYNKFRQENPGKGLKDYPYKHLPVPR